MVPACLSAFDEGEQIAVQLIPVGQIQPMGGVFVHLEPGAWNQFHRSFAESSSGMDAS
jgi:hypothetical protein